MADVTITGRFAGTFEKMVDLGDGHHALAVTIAGLETPVELTGDILVDALGAVDDAAVSDPDAASATIPALLRGILAELQAQTVLLTTIAANTDPGP